MIKLITTILSFKHCNTFTSFARQELDNNTNSHVASSVLWHFCNSPLTTSRPKIEEKGIVGKHLRVILESNPKS